MQTLDRIHSKPPISLRNCSRDEIRAYFINTWEIYEWLFSSIGSDEALYQNPDPRRHPLIFYLGHTAVFYINKLVANGVIADRINPEFEHLFAVGVDPATAKDLETRDLWPAAADVRAYRKQVYDRVLAVIDQADFGEKVDWEHPLWALFMGLEHDRIHFETSSVLIRQYPVELVQRPEGWAYAPTTGQPVPNDVVRITGGSVTLGRPADSDHYGWDNEYGQHTVEVGDFAVSRNMVSNAEFLEFVQTGGYATRDHWSDTGWEWKQKYEMQHPKFWVPGEDGFRYRAMFDILPMPLDWPAEVTCHEAEAYCKWKGGDWRLLWEREWKFLANQCAQQQDDTAFYPHYNLNLNYGSPCCVGIQQQDQGATPVNDIYGNVWEWLGDNFYRLPGFKVHPIYKDFSDPYFDEEHGMLAGGAWATSGTGASPYYRLWFRRGFIQHAGFRLAMSL